MAELAFVEPVDDDVHDIGASTKDLFGDDEEQLEDFNVEVEEEEDTRPTTAPSETLSVEDRRAALQKLVAKQKTGDGLEKKQKKKKRDREEKEGEKPKRSRRDVERKVESQKPSKRGADDEDIPSEELDEELEDDEDFIDDEGVAIEEGAVAAGSEGGEDEDAPTAALLGPPEEAIEDNEDEADDGDDPFGHKKRKRRKETDQQMANIVDDKIAKMEAAAEADMEEHQNRRPAIHKLKVLAEVEEFLAQKKYHELFISSGGLGVLKAWVEPYADGSLPNARVRAAVLRGCQLLPIDTTREDMKAQLKRSELGKRVLFLSMCSAETMENKRMARELVQNWSRPIYDDPDAEAEKKRIRSKQLEKARLANVAMQRAAEAKKAAQRPALRPGDPGWRMHASIPQATKLDYVHEPSVSERVQQASAAAAAAAAHAPEKSSRFAKKMREVLRKQKSTAARAAKPSVEGRTITLLN